MIFKCIFFSLFLVSSGGVLRTIHKDQPGDAPRKIEPKRSPIAKAAAAKPQITRRTSLKVEHMAGLTHKEREPHQAITRNATMRSNLTPIMGSFDFELHKPVGYENTFQLKPNSGTPKLTQLKALTYKLLQENYIQEFSGNYNSATCRYHAKNLADIVKSELKRQVDPRYKVITACQIGENNGQMMRIKSGFLWNDNMDRYLQVQHSFGKTGLFCVLEAFFVYFD